MTSEHTEPENILPPVGDENVESHPTEAYKPYACARRLLDVVRESYTRPDQVQGIVAFTVSYQPGSGSPMIIPYITDVPLPAMCTVNQLMQYMTNNMVHAAMTDIPRGS